MGQAQEFIGSTHKRTISIIDVAVAFACSVLSSLLLRSPFNSCRKAFRCFSLSLFPSRAPNIAYTSSVFRWRVLKSIHFIHLPRSVSSMCESSCHTPVPYPRKFLSTLQGSLWLRALREMHSGMIALSAQSVQSRNMLPVNFS